MRSCLENLRRGDVIETVNRYGTPIGRYVILEGGERFGGFSWEVSYPGSRERTGNFQTHSGDYLVWRVLKRVGQI